jgi:outer membrane biogenesis lipoprotein LolB
VESRRVDDRWRILTRVRDLRARLALNEVSQRRQVEARAQAGLDQALRRQAQYEQLAVQVSESLAARLREGDGAVFSAEDAQQLLGYATGARLKAREAATPVRRAKMQRDRAHAVADEARARYRREAERRDAVYFKWQEAVKIQQRLRLGREEEVHAEERVGANSALSQAGVDEP